MVKGESKSLKEKAYVMRLKNRNKNMIFIWVLLVVGICLMILGLSFTFNIHHKEVVSSRTYFSEEIPGYIHVKYSTKDAFVAGNPIDAVIRTGIIMNVETIQLTFDGAGSYFPADYDFSSVNPEDIRRSHESLRKSMNNVVPLEREVSSAGIVHFTGEATGLVYSQGGNFDIGITMAAKDSGVIGYEMGKRNNYRITEGISISPPETSLAIRNNNLMVGIAWIAVGMSLFIPTLMRILSPS